MASAPPPSLPSSSSPPPPLFARILRRARAEIAPLGVLLGLALAALIFIKIADDMAEADGQAFDLAVLQALRPDAAAPAAPWGPWQLHEAAADLTALGGVSVLGLFALLAGVFLMLQRKHLSALMLAAGLAGGVALSEGLKGLFDRARPPVEYQAIETLNASFPSGHALLATVFYLTVGAMLARAFPRWRFKVFAVAAGVLIALLVGLTRIYLGAHWASDVFAGWCVGAAWAAALWLAAHVVERLTRDRPGPHDAEAATSGLSFSRSPSIGPPSIGE